MSAADFLRQFMPDLTDWQIDVLLSDARFRRDREEERWRRRKWRRVDSRVGGVPRLSRMRTAYRKKHR